MLSDQTTSSGSGLFGDATSLMVHVSLPSFDITMMPADSVTDSGPHRSDEQTVSYSFGLPPDASAGQAGLLRTVGDRLGMDLASSEGNGLAGATELLAPEVTSVQFRYFDGVQWREDWDSDTLGGLPFAVEIQIAVQMPGPAKAGFEASTAVGGTAAVGGAADAQTYRLVVALSAASMPEEQTTDDASGSSSSSSSSAGS